MNIANLITWITTILTFAIIGRVILNLIIQQSPSPPEWMRMTQDILVRITEPILAPIRRLVYRGGPFDLSPMIAILLMWMISLAFSSV